MMQVLILEDESKSALELKRMIETLRPDMQVVEIAPSVKAGLRWLKAHTPGLIFADIQLGDGLSFDIFREQQVEAPVIFCTAYDEYAIRAFEANGIDYLLKPMDEEKLKRSLQKFDTLKTSFTASSAGNMQHLLRDLHTPHKTTLLVRFQEKIIPLKTMDIAYIYASSGQTSAATLTGDTYNINNTLEELEQSLSPAMFYRINRQFLVNRSAIKGIEHYFTRRLHIKLTIDTPETLLVSKQKAPEFLKWMETT
ncbi:MAG: LytR/AlgR family response regulator transcription factor [Chitinophagaceae bacterium]